MRPAKEINKSDFGEDFVWGVASSAYQIEGAYQEDGKGWSIWDEFTNHKRFFLKRANGNVATDFYHKYPEDIELMGRLGFSHFRYSLSWPRIIPDGKGDVNQKGLDFYKNLVDTLLENGIQPWLSFYHWDLPFELEKKGGWTNRKIVDWFLRYVKVCVKEFGDRVKHWMVMNEPNVFTGAGYGIGMHAPGRWGLRDFLPALHHAMLAQAEAGRLIREIKPEARIGATFSITPIDPWKETEKDLAAANRVNILVNRLCLDPLLGNGYPVKELPFLRKIEKYCLVGDLAKLPFDMDFLGIQPYTREVVKHAFYIPYIKSMRVFPSWRKAHLTAMNWEYYPKTIYRALKQVSNYQNVPTLYITENGVALNDRLENGKVQDLKRIVFIQDSLQYLLKAKEEGVKVKGYFHWTFTDNLEWAEGYKPRFGIVHVDRKTLKRTVKQSGYWWKNFLWNGNPHLTST